jgi:hypothetical protein
MFNKLMTAFKETGLSAKASTELISGITMQIGKLSIAQKSFLSAQTGGPGGLVGGFQIEKMLRDGKIDEVFDKMQTQMKRQFGKIVSIDEAAQSPQAAAQLVRQREMLKSGPLGQFAQTDDQAQRILDAFKKGEKVDVKELSKGDDLLNRTLETGKSVQEKNTPIFKQTLGAIESIRDEGSKVTNDLLEGILTTGAGGKAGREIANAIRAGQSDATRRDVGVTGREGRAPVDVGAVNVARGIKTVGNDIRALPSVGTVAAKRFGEKMSTTTAREARTGVTAASNTEANTGNYMNLAGRNAEDIRRWTAIQNGTAPDERLGTARTVGAVNTGPTTAAAATADRGRAGTQRGQQQSITVKVEPIKIEVDASGVARVEHNPHAAAAMNSPNGGK